MGLFKKRQCRVHGTVAPGFEPVRELFEQQMQTMAEETAQLCVYHRGKRVVDLWADLTDDGTFSADSLVNVFSSGKSLEAIAVASLVGQGLLQYEARITDYWPEFGANGKDGLTVADLMRHEAGLASFDTSLDMEDLFTENIKNNAVGRVIEQHAPRFGAADGGKREYHALTRGWIVNELFRRVDPTGRTIGEFLREEISGPLEADVVIGVRDEEMARVARVKSLGFGYQLLQGLIPRILGRRIVHNIFQILGRLFRVIPGVIKSGRSGAPPPFTGFSLLDYFDNPDFARGETPSANANCSARGLARLGAMMSAGGTFEGRQYLTPAAWEALHQHPVEAHLGSLLITRFTQGGVDCFTPCTPYSARLEREFNEGREGFYGWMGFGGSIFQWHPEMDIGFAFVPTSLHVLDFFNERGKRYQAEVLRCAAAAQWQPAGSGLSSVGPPLQGAAGTGELVMPLTESHAVGPDQPAVRDITIGQGLAEAAAECPERIAMIAGTADPAGRRQWTYGELYQQSLVVARALTTRFQPGERVAVWAPNIPEWVMMEYGCALAGVVLVTVNPSFQADEIRYVLTQSRSAGVFLLPEFRGNRMLHHLESILEDCPELREVVRLDQWQAFLDCGEDDSISLPDVAPGDACMIQYTSGTTGFPKGALLHHRGLVNNGAHTVDRMGFPEGGTYLGYMPLFHTGGCVCGVLGCLAKRGTMVLMEMFEPGLALELMETYRANAMLGVPTMHVAMIEHPDFATRDLSSIQAICSGGSTVPQALVKRLEETLRAPFTIVFGQTECSPVASMTRASDTLEDKANTLGGPMPNVEVKIIDPESGATVPVNTLGEYCTRGYHVMHEYFEMPEATAKTIDGDGWLHTGDLCSMDERGYCKVEGRLKDMIIRGGENIYPREIEELLFKHPSVGEVAVVGLPSERMGEEVGAFLRAAPGERIDKDRLYAYLREHLSPQKTPRYWFEVAEYPLTGSGKIQKFALRQQWQAGQHKEI